VMADEFYVTSPVVHAFMTDVLQVVAAEPSAPRCIERIRSHFAELLATSGWLPEEFACPSPTSKMGGNIASYLLFRRTDPTLTLHALVIPPASITPVHDHLAWGLVGLYRGEQEEEIFRHTGSSPSAHGAHLELVERRQLRPGDFYALLPPEGDIHRVRTTSEDMSVSIHLLGNDLGCTWRHAYDVEKGAVSPFRSGYANVDCSEE
jgi:predicted metal-dependent enzyme (double-stranded beta helix superfamily)